MNSTKKLKIAAIAITAAICMSTAGYMFIEGASLLDAFFMTVITLSTVGYGEIIPLSDQGRLFSSFMILLNIGTLGYTVSAFTEFIVDGQFFKDRKLKNMEKKVQRVKNHIIICGYSRYAEESIRHFSSYGQPVLLIDRSEERVNDFEKRHPNGLFIQGDGSADDILQRAQIKKAKAIICAMSDNSENVFITLTARHLNPDIQIIARTADNRTEAKLRKAGANHVIMPERISGFYMATVVNKPGTVEFFDRITNEWQSEVHIEEIEYEDIKNDFKDRPLGELSIQEITGANIIGYKDEEGNYIINPAEHLLISEGTSLIALGTELQIRALLDYCG